MTTEKVGRVRTCKLGPQRLEDETAWLNVRVGGAYRLVFVHGAAESMSFHRQVHRSDAVLAASVDERRQRREAGQLLESLER